VLLLQQYVCIHVPKSKLCFQAELFLFSCNTTRCKACAEQAAVRQYQQHVTSALHCSVLCGRCGSTSKALLLLLLLVADA
jgi:hypothetical protein